MDAQSGFPKFKDGDVCIVVSINRIYQLHSHTLRRLSPVFAQQLESFPGAKLTAAARREGAAAYRFELNKPNADDFGRFIRIRVLDNGKPQREFWAGGNHINDDDIRLWDWLFGSFYHIKPKFEDHNLATLRRDCMELVDLADGIGSMTYVCGIVDHALLNQDQNLWKSIAANPTAWTELGCRIHSQRIFREGIIHLVGLWQGMTAEEKNELRPEIRDLCRMKYQELDFAKQAIEMRILGHYPTFLHRSHLDKPDRSSYSTDIYMWMAVCFYRHYFAQAISENRLRTAHDGGFAFYHTLAQGGAAYMHHEDFSAFHQYFPMSSKACKVLEANMNVLKDDVKVFVRDLIVSRSQIKATEYPIRWLTCAVINKEDYPWETENQAITVEYQADAAMYDETDEDDAMTMRDPSYEGETA